MENKEMTTLTDMELVNDNFEVETFNEKGKVNSGSLALGVGLGAGLVALGIWAFKKFKNKKIKDQEVEVEEIVDGEYAEVVEE